MSNECMVHLFGATSSPGVANFSLQKTADFLQNEEAINLIQTTQAMGVSGNLCLHKFASNRRKVLEALPVNDRAKDLKDLLQSF